MLTLIGAGGRFTFPIIRVFYTASQSFFDARNAFLMRNAKPLKTCLKDNGTKYFAVIKYKEFQFY